MAQAKERSSFFGSRFIFRAAKTGLSLPRNQMETLLRRLAAYKTRKCGIKKSNVEPRTNINSTLGYALPSILSEQFQLNSSQLTINTYIRVAIRKKVFKPQSSFELSYEGG